MTINSMTGFARSEGAHDGARWFWELRSVNGRGLDLRFRLPQGLESLEHAGRIMVGERFKRGSISASLTLTTRNTIPRIVVNSDVLAQIVAAIQTIRVQTDAGPPSAGELLTIRGVLEQEEITPDESAMTARDAAILTSFATALDGLVKARNDEGRRLSTVLHTQVQAITDMTAQARSMAATQPETLRARMSQSIQQLMDAGATIAPDRLAQELALLATKADVREELDRLRAHVAQARQLMTDGEAAGRRLDFLAQEFNREANTLCSKSTDIELTRLGLGLKAVIDQFKEQVQNVE